MSLVTKNHIFSQIKQGQCIGQLTLLTDLGSTNYILRIQVNSKLEVLTLLTDLGSKDKNVLLRVILELRKKMRFLSTNYIVLSSENCTTSFAST